MNLDRNRTVIQLADYRRQVAGLYAQIRASEPESGWVIWSQKRDDLFKNHPQSALPSANRTHFHGLRYFPYNPEFRFLVEIETAPTRKCFDIELEGEGSLRLESFGQVHFTLQGRKAGLVLFWIQSYGGGIFLPFRDATNGKETYQGGRYLLDTIKGADLGVRKGKLILDFNFAYNPSCAYNEAWLCPLAPTENWLEVAIEAGEKSPTES